MQSYVITFYRFGDAGHSGEVVGILTDPNDGREQRFANLAELHALIDRVAGTPPRRSKPRTRRPQ